MATIRIANAASRIFLSQNKNHPWLVQNNGSSCFISGSCRRWLNPTRGCLQRTTTTLRLSSSSAAARHYRSFVRKPCCWNGIFRGGGGGGGRSVLFQPVYYFSSLPKRYQKRDDETQQDYELRVKELRLQDAYKHYQSLLPSASSSLNSEGGEEEEARDQDHEAKLLESMEQLRQAFEDLQYWDKAIAIEEKILQKHRTSSSNANDENTEEQHQQQKVATSCIKLGDLHLETGQNYVEARRYYKQALDIYTQLHQPSAAAPAQQLDDHNQQQQQQQDSPPPSSNQQMHADIGTVMHRVAMTYARQEEFVKAINFLTQAKDHFVYHGLPLPVNENDEIPDGHQTHPGIFQIFEDHAMVYRIVENFDMALSVYQEAYSYAKEFELDAKSEMWDDLELNMADCQLALGYTDRASYIYQKLLDKAVAQRLKATEGASSTAGKDTTNEISKEEEDAMSLECVTRHNIGHIHAKEGRYKEALSEFMKSYILKKQVSKSETHPELINTLHGLGAVNATLGNVAEAKHFFREALVISRIHADPELGDDDPKVSYAIRNLEKVQENQRPQPF